MLKILLFYMALNQCEMWSNGIKTTFFLEIIKIAEKIFLNVSKFFFLNLPKFVEKSVSGGWGLRPQTTICETIEFHLFTQQVYLFKHFHFVTFGLSPLPLANSWFSAMPGHRRSQGGTRGPGSPPQLKYHQ